MQGGGNGKVAFINGPMAVQYWPAMASIETTTIIHLDAHALIGAQLLPPAMSLQCRYDADIRLADNVRN